ncbi:hypothetical protein D3C80_1236820 [compost metagenome]
MQDAALCLNHGAWPIGIVVHHIVWVDQVDREEPRLALRGELAPLAAQPASSHGGDDAVVEISALGMSDDVANAEVVGEAVGLHFLRENLGWSVDLVGGLELLGQMPLAFVSGVVPRPTQHVPNGWDLGGHAFDPWEVGVIEHPCMLDVLAGVEHRARWSTHTGADAVIHEGRALFHQPFVRGQAVASR